MRVPRPARGAVLLSLGLVLGASTIALGGPSDGPGTDYVRGVHVVKAMSAKTSNSQKDLYVECPPGEYAIGGGADVDSAFTGRTNQFVSAVALRTSQPSNGLVPVPEAQAGPPTKGWHATAMETTATTLKWTLTVYAICASSGAPSSSGRLLSDIAVEKEWPCDDCGAVRPGEDTTFTVKVTNHGPDDDTGVVVTDTPDPRLSLKSSTGPSDCTQTGGTVTCDAIDLAAGESRTYELVFTLADDANGFEYENCADVKGDNADAAGSNDHSCAYAFGGDS